MCVQTYLSKKDTACWLGRKGELFLLDTCFGIITPSKGYRRIARIAKKIAQSGQESLFTMQAKLSCQEGITRLFFEVLGHMCYKAV